MATKKKKTSAGRVRKSKRKSAAKKTSSKKSATKRQSASRSASVASTRKTSSKKAKTKAGSRKKTGRAVSKKKTTKKKSAKSAARKKTKKKAPSQKSVAGKKTKKKTSKKTVAKKTSSKTKAAGGKTSSTGETKTTTKTKTGKKGTVSESAESKTPAKGKNKRSQSVVEAASGAEADKQGYVFINGRRVRMISTQGKGIARKPKKTAAELAKDEQRQAIKLGKTKLSKKELRYYRDMLLIKRAELVGDLTAMEAEALRSSGGNISHMPIHMADIGSDTYEQDFMLGLAETERKQIREIDDALMRIKDSTYGVCQMTGKPIPKARLDAKPWAKYTIEAARKMEGHWQP